VILIGTSGYHFPDWAGPFYPPDLPKPRWLAYYAEHFPAVEINSTYYGLPKRDTVLRWREETPEGFRFIVKLNRASTHERKGRGEEIGELLDLLTPLREAGKLSGLLAQFPASFHAEAASENYLAALTRHTDGVPLFIELRHASWDRDRSVELCRELGVGWVVVDQPALPGLMGIRAAVTSGTAYVRFHGRNAGTWYHKERGDRYDWEYSDPELRSWIPRLSSLASHAETSYLFFNNCHAGQAIKNARMMKQILRLSLGTEVV